MSFNLVDKDLIRLNGWKLKNDKLNHKITKCMFLAKHWNSSPKLGVPKRLDVFLKRSVLISWETYIHIYMWPVSIQNQSKN